MRYQHEADRPQGSSDVGRCTKRLEAMFARPAGQCDDEISRQAVRCLQWSLRVPADSIEVTVENRWVTLRGTVDWRYQRAAAESAVRELGGVCGVTNLIRVRPHADDEDVREKMIDLACTWQCGNV